MIKFKKRERFLTRLINLVKIKDPAAAFLFKLAFFVFLFTAVLCFFSYNDFYFEELGWKNFQKENRPIFLKNNYSIEKQKDLLAGEESGRMGSVQYFFKERLAGKCNEDLENQRCSELCGVDVLTEDLRKELYPPKVKVVRTAPRPRVINAPKPHSYKVVNGKMVCDKKNDKPGKSNKGKKRHMDMECCLDPDEWPNPHCTYYVGKYGKYLNNKPK